MTGEPEVREAIAGDGGSGRPVRVLLASARDWFASALQAVLEPEGFSFTQLRSGEAVLERVDELRPDLVIIDEGLPDIGTPELCRRLVRTPSGSSLPILVYSPNFWQETEQAEAMRAGAWDVIREPVRSLLLVAKLRRLLRIRALIESVEREAASDGGLRLFTFAGLVRVLPVLGSLAQRQRVPISCAFFGPTRAAGEGLVDRHRREAARLCAAHTRLSDVCAPVGEGDLVLVAYDADPSEATLIIRRLGQLISWEEADRGEPLSAGIVELSPEEFVRGREAETAAVEAGAPAERVARLARFAAAQSALREARESGGGIRIAEVA